MINFTENSRQALTELVQGVGNRFHHSTLGAEHLFIALLHLPETSGAIRILTKLGYNPIDISTLLEEGFGTRPEEAAKLTTFSYTKGYKSVLVYASRKSRQLQADQIRSEHLLFAAILDVEGIVQTVCEKIGLKSTDVMSAILESENLTEE